METVWAATNTRTGARLPARHWRHLDFSAVMVFLRYALRRVQCRCCGVIVEQVPGSEHVDSRFAEGDRHQ